jgi:hypothetical protein
MHKNNKRTAALRYVVESERRRLRGDGTVARSGVLRTDVLCIETLDTPESAGMKW